MKTMKKCEGTQNKISIKEKLDKRRYRRRSSAGMFYTSSAGAVTSLILMRRCSIVPLSIIVSLCFINTVILGLTGASNTFAVGTVSLSVSSNTVDLSIAPTRATGTFGKSDNISISASTNNSTGYTLMLAASSSANYDKLINSSNTACDNTGINENSNAGNNSSNCLNSIKNATTEAEFSALSGSSYNGLWGYLPSKYNSSANTDFLPAPTVGGDILDKTSTANSTANNYTLAIGARVDSTTKMGAYTNTYNVVLVANEVLYTITYDDSIISGLPIDVSSASSASSVNISSSIPTRDGYEFAGWCTVRPTFSSSGLNQCSGTTYTAGQSWTLGASDNNLYLYAMWNESIGQCTNRATCMQFMNKQTLSTLMPTVGSSTTLYDMRDGQAYTVALLADGKYWMTKNLNLPGGTELHSYDTDMPEGYTLPTANNFQSGNRLPTSTTAGFDDNTKAFVYNSGSTTCGNNSPCYSYYSWTAATLGSGLGIATENTDAPYSICPKGWNLPTSGNHESNGWKRGDIYWLATAYGANLSSNYAQSTTTFYNNAGPGTTPNFLLGGYYLSGSFSRGGTYGYYWSSTSVGSSADARCLLFGSGNVYSATDYPRLRGFPVRCLYGV